jgi:acyl carrier protein
MDELIKILRESCPGVDFQNETALVDGEILDSLDIVTIVSEIMGTFHVKLNVEDIIPAHFNSAAAMWELIQVKRK